MCVTPSGSRAVQCGCEEVFLGNLGFCCGSVALHIVGGTLSGSGADYMCRQVQSPFAVT